MGYNVIDLIDKAIKVSIRKKEIYKSIGKENCDIPSIQIMSKVISKEIDKTIKYYETLKVEIGDVEFEEIDLYIYDKMSFLIDEFNKRVYVTKINNVKEYLKFSLELEKDVQSLLIDVQGRFVKSTSDLHTKTYEILTFMINNKAQNIATLEKTLK
ncbi:MAG: hypothetical protein H7Y18_09510 [Clostridiaceae bacterium]|nr:hypothetical protein [Clostridiaceae bacterium]